MTQELNDGLPAREAALNLIDAALSRRGGIDEAASANGFRFLEPRERAFARALAMAVLRHLGPIDRALAAFEEAASELDERFDVAAISAACALGYLDFRMPDLNWRRDCPKLAAWYSTVSQRPSLVATAPVH